MFMIPNGRRQRSADLVPFGRFDRVFEDVLAGFPTFAAGGRSWVPATDVSESDDAVTLSLELPGVRPEDVKISLENETLTIRAEKKATTEDEGHQRRVERSYGIFERRFSVSPAIDTDAIEATQSDGVLTLVLPKSERAKSREITIKS